MLILFIYFISFDLALKQFGLLFYYLHREGWFWVQVCPQYSLQRLPNVFPLPPLTFKTVPVMTTNPRVILYLEKILLLQVMLTDGVLQKEKICKSCIIYFDWQVVNSVYLKRPLLETILVLGFQSSFCIIDHIRNTQWCKIVFWEL